MINHDTPEMRKLAEAAVWAAFDRAERILPIGALTRPSILWRNCGSTAGYADYTRMELTLSPFFLGTQGQRFIDDTPIHEAAHFAAREVYGAKGHCSFFYSMMRTMGAREEFVTRCHSFDSAGAPRQTRKRALYQRVLDSL